MRVRVRMFGALAERAGLDREELDLPEGATAGEILRMVGDRHPDAAGILGRISVAVNLEVVPPERRVSAGDEVALLPPVAGGTSFLVGLRPHPSVDEALASVAAPDAGGTAVFVGTVRDHSEAGAVDRLEYSAYADMADRVFTEIAEEAARKWPLAGVAVLHGTGDLRIGDVTMVVACSAAHRGEAFEACRYLVDEVKRRAPIWKKELGPSVGRWVGLEP